MLVTRKHSAPEKWPEPAHYFYLVAMLVPRQLSGNSAKAMILMLQKYECLAISGAEVMIVFSKATRYSIRGCCT